MAAREDEIVTVWIREAVLMRISLIDEKKAESPTQFETAGGEGEPISVRFRPQDLRRVVRAAKSAPAFQGLSSWIRAVVIEHVQKILAPPTAA